MIARKLNDATIKLKTGKSSKEWTEILDNFKNPNHTLMAKYLREKHKVASWWSQTLTNRYEWERGLRNK
jgi:hypothetical protein